MSFWKFLALQDSKGSIFLLFFSIFLTRDQFYNWPTTTPLGNFCQKVWWPVTQLFWGWIYLSNEKTLVCWVLEGIILQCFLRDYFTSHEIRISIKQPGFFLECHQFVFFSWLTFRKPQFFQQKTSWPIWVPGSHKTPRTSSRWGETQRNPSCQPEGFFRTLPAWEASNFREGFSWGVVIWKLVRIKDVTENLE